MILVRNRVDNLGREEWVLENAAIGNGSPGGMPFGTLGRPGRFSHRIATRACKVMKHVLDKYLTTPPPDLDHECWGFLAEHINYH